MRRESRAGRRRSTLAHLITDVAIELFAGRGFDDVSVDDVAEAAGIARRTLFRYYPSKNALPWGDFDAHLAAPSRSACRPSAPPFPPNKRCATRCCRSTLLTIESRAIDSECG